MPDPEARDFTRAEMDSLLLEWIREAGGKLMWPCPTPGCRWSTRTKGHVCTTEDWGVAGR